MNPFDAPPWQWTEKFIATHCKWIDNKLLGRVIVWCGVFCEARAQLLEHLLVHIKDINAKCDLHGNRALHIACSQRRVDCVQVLLQCGADPNVTTSLGWTPLMESLHVNDMDSAKLLLEHKAHVHARTKSYDTIVHFVTNIKQENDVIKSLFEVYGADPHRPGGNTGLNTIQYCVVTQNEWLLAWLLQRHPESVNLMSDGYGSLLQMCIFQVNSKLTKHLLAWAHCDVWHLTPDQKNCANGTIRQQLTQYHTHRVEMQMWAALHLQKSAVLSQYFSQHLLFDVHLWEEWMIWITPSNNQ